MPWSEILHHEQQIDRFRKSVQRNRLASTYLFVGKPGIGKRTFALKLAEVLLCENKPAGFDSCGSCPACQQVQAQTHPDLSLISKPKDKAYIPVELFIGDKEHRRQVGLCHELSLKPFRGGRKIAIIDDADFLNQEGANSLLKTLEEPPPRSLLILIGSTQQRQLSTIVSRSQVVRFEPLLAEEVATLLGRQSDLDTTISIEELASVAAGSVELALKLAEPDVYDFRLELIRQLATGDPGQREFSKTLMGFVDAAGKEGARKRTRLQWVADFAIDFYRNCYLEILGEPPSTDSNQTVTDALRNISWVDEDAGAEQIGNAIDRCIELQHHVAVNVSPANAIEGWLIDLGRICRGQALQRLNQ